MMKIDFADGRVTMVVCPVDCRCGYRRLADIAYKVLNIDVSLGEDYVVFVSKSRGICKIIHCDESTDRFSSCACCTADDSSAF